MSLDEEGNFMARWGVETTALRVLRDGWSRRTLYDVGASTTRKRMGLFWFGCHRGKQCGGLCTHKWRPSPRRNCR